MNDMHHTDVSAPSTITTASITMSHARLTAIASLLACAATDDVMPTIGGINLTAKDGIITAEATNRYVAGIIEFNSDSITGEFVTNIPAKPLKQFVAASKLTGRFNTDVERITINVTDDTITFSDLNTGSTLTTAPIRGNFPPIARLFPEISSEPVEVAPYGMDANLLATVSKISVLGDKYATWTVQNPATPTGKPGPVLFHTRSGDRATFKILVQPKLNLR